MDSLRRSFKQISSHVKIVSTSNRGVSSGGVDQTLESQPILSDLDDMKSIDSSGRKDFVVKVEDNPETKNIDLEVPTVSGGEVHNASNIVRGSSYDFWKEDISSNGCNEFDLQLGQKHNQNHTNVPVGREEDPPSKLIGQFLHKQKAAGEIALDMDLEMDDSIPQNPAYQQASPRDTSVSFQDEENHNRSFFRGSSNVSSNEGRGDVLRCTSNASIKPSSSFLRRKTTKSRLIDPPVKDEQQARASGITLRSAQLRSGLTGRTDDDDEDPFADEDLPDNLKKEKLSTLTVCQWVSLILILAGFVCSLTIPVLYKKKLWDLDLWKWMLFVLVLFCGRLVSGWGIRLVVFFIERNFLLRKRVLYFVYGVRKAVQNCLWLALVLIAWHYLFDEKVKKEIRSNTLPYTITKILICLLVTTLLWLVKTLLVKVLASFFHVSRYFERIQESLFNQHVIVRLSGPPFIGKPSAPPLIDIQQNQERNDGKFIAEVQNLQNAGAKMSADLKATMKSGKVIDSGRVGGSPQVRRSFKSSARVSSPLDKGIAIDKLHKLNQKNVSAWNMKRLMKIVRHGVLSTLAEQIQDSTHKVDASTHIRTEFQAKCAAKKIFHNVARPGSKYIYLEDLMHFLTEDEATKSMSLFEGAAETKRVTRSALRNWVVNAFRERRALALTLDDTKTAVNQLHHMVNVVMGIIIIIIWLLILGIASSQLLVIISSQLLLVVFMFGNTCKMVFEAIIFLFVMHPFDVGDRCEIDGVQMVVEEMNILTTVFLRLDNQKITYPNSILSTKPIGNYYRSPDMGDSIDFCIHISTPAEKIALMKQRIKGFVDNKAEHWRPNPIIVVKDVEDMNKLKLSLWTTHTMNHQDMDERWVRRSILVEEMVKIFRELDIEYRMLPIDVNMQNMPPVTTTRVPSNWTALQ